MYQYKSPNIMSIKIDESMLWDISKYLEHQKWIQLGRELKIPDQKLQPIQISEARNEHDLRESAYQMLKVWHERTGKCLVQDLLTALRRQKWKPNVQGIEKLMRRYYWNTQPASKDTSKWSNLNQRILRSIVLKIQMKLYQNCIIICKSWYENERELYTNWMNKNCANWTKSSFQNALERKVNCKEVYFKSSEEWTKTSAPTLIKEIDTGDKIGHISFSNDGTMLAVCHRYPHFLQIYDLKDFSVRFSRDFYDCLYSSHFNSSDSCILACTSNNIHVIANTVGLPTLHYTSSRDLVRRPWLQDNIFLTYRKDYKTDTITFWLNKMPQEGDADKGIPESQIHRARGYALIPGIIQTGGRNILLYTIFKTTKLAFKIIPENIFGKFSTKQNDKKIETPDHEVDCKGIVWDYTFVPDGNTKEVYVLTERNENDYCFMIIDLVNFELKTSILLVPHYFQNRGNLVSNSKCIISGNGLKQVCVWDLKSGACTTHRNKADIEYYLCEINSTNPELIITAGYFAKTFKLWRLNTPKYPSISPQKTNKNVT